MRTAAKIKSKRSVIPKKVCVLDVVPFGPDTLQVTSKPILWVGLIFFGFAILASFTQPTEAWALILIGVGCYFVAAMPLIARSTYFVFEPAVFFLFSVTVGATLRTFYLVYSGNVDQIFLLTDGLSVHQLLPGAFAAFLGVVTLSLGYMSVTFRVRLGILRWLENDSWSEARVWFLVLTAMSLSVLGFGLFAAETGVDITGLEDISKKRYITLDSDVGERTQTALGYLRMLASFANLAFFILVAWVVSERHRWGLYRRFSYYAVVALCFSVAAAFPFFTSSRTGILTLVLGGLVVFSLIAGRIPWGRVAIGGCGLLLVAVIMADLRGMRSDGSGENIVGPHSTRYIGEEVVDKVVGSGNFYPLDRVAVIVPRIPEYMAYQYGRTYLAVIVSPIPRVAWPEKPPISLGPVVRGEIWRKWVGFGGYPPGITGEAFMNFGWFGVVTVPFFIGAAIRVWFNTMRPYLGRSRGAAVLYASMVWAVGQQMVDLNFSLALTNALMEMAVVITGLMILRVVVRPA